MGKSVTNVIAPDLAALARMLVVVTVVLISVSSVVTARKDLVAGAGQPGSWDSFGSDQDWRQYADAAAEFLSAAEQPEDHFAPYSDLASSSSSSSSSSAVQPPSGPPNQPDFVDSIMDFTAGSFLRAFGGVPQASSGSFAKSAMDRTQQQSSAYLPVGFIPDSGAITKWLKNVVPPAGSFSAAGSSGPATLTKFFKNIGLPPADAWLPNIPTNSNNRRNYDQQPALPEVKTKTSTGVIDLDGQPVRSRTTSTSSKWGDSRQGGPEGYAFSTYTTFGDQQGSPQGYSPQQETRAKLTPQATSSRGAAQPATSVRSSFASPPRGFAGSSGFYIPWSSSSSQASGNTRVSSSSSGAAFGKEGAFDVQWNFR